MRGVALASAVTLAVLVPLVVLPPDGGDDDQDRPAVSRAQAAQLAHEACVLVRTLIAEVTANGPTNTVLEVADRARDAADDAAYGSPEWVPLNGAVQALARALHVNNATLAASGMQQIDTACEKAGVRVR